MPITVTCKEHVDFCASTLDRVSEHVQQLHARDSYKGLKSRGVLVSRFVSQAEAQGQVPLRIYACRRCGRRVERRDGGASIYCAECEEAG